MSVTIRKKGKTIHSSERHCILNVIKRCDEEAEKKCLLTPLSKASERAANYCCVSLVTIKRIRGEARKATGSYQPQHSSSTSESRKKRKRTKEKTFNVDDFDRRVIKDTIGDFYVKKRVLPTAKNLLPILKEQIGFKWGERCLRELLNDLGFKWKKCGQKKKKVLMERPSIVNGRGEYLKRVAKLREEGRYILYIGEAWVDTSLTFKKCWEGGESLKPTPNRLIIGHIGGSQGFIQECGLVFKAEQMNSDYFFWWIKEKVIPVLTTPSVIVMDNAPYHCEYSGKVPTKNSPKKHKIEYLKSKHVAFDASLRNFELFQIIQEIQPKTKTYKVDELLEYYGHKVLRLPPYMPDLNPIELAWAKVDHFIRNNGSTSGDMSISALETLVLNGVASVTPQDWNGYCNHVIRIEKEYWTEDAVMENAIEAVIGNLGEDVSDSSDEESSDASF